MDLETDGRSAVSSLYGDSLEETPVEVERPDDYPVSNLSDDERDVSEDAGGGGDEAVTIHASAFHLLPPQLIEHILYLADPGTFASLVLLNKAWREASQTPHLYAHHLSRCPSYSQSNDMITGPFTTHDLSRLRGLFAVEAKRNLFEAFLRPRETIIDLISISPSSSAAFPRGEAFRFIFSPHGRTVLALSSGRIFVVDVSSDPVQVKRELKTLRRPLSAAILDDGSLLAVLSTKHQANLYHLDEAGVCHVRTLSFDNVPRTISLSPEGTVLAAAYDGGVEVYSLAEHALSTDRRAVRCDGVDALAFSSDSTMVLGTSVNLQDPNFVVITAPYYSENGADANPREIQSRMWTTQILFPNSSRNCSHATFLHSHHEGEGNWIFAYDPLLGCFRIVKLENTQDGVAYFLGPNLFSRMSRVFPSTLPTTSSKGDLAATGYTTNGIWLYGIPHRVDTAPKWNQSTGNGGVGLGLAAATNSSLADRQNLSMETDYSMMEDDEPEQLSEYWQDVLEGRGHLFIKGRQISGILGVTAVRWVDHCDPAEGKYRGGDRLVAVAPGGVVGSKSDIGEEDFPVDGGRIVILDFDRSPYNGDKSNVTIEVGEIEPELLPEESQNIESEVALVRTRTQRQNRDATRLVSLGRSQTGSGPHLHSRRSDATDSRRVRTPSATVPLEGATIDEVAEAFEGPYSHTSPRSRTTLHRAATAAAANRQRHPPLVSTGHIVYRRSDGRELPHESDADNWVPPPPPYTPDADGPLPEHLRRTLMSSRTEPIQRMTRPPPQPVRANTRLESFASSTMESALQRTRSTMGAAGAFTRHGSIRAHFGRRDDAEGGSISTISGRRTSSVGEFSTVHPSSPRRRPVASQQAHASNNRLSEPFIVQPTDPQSSPESIRATLRSPISPIPEPVILSPSPLDAGRESSSGARPTLTQSAEGRSLTLSGSNLQNRLDYPVPPTPRLENGPVHARTPSSPARESPTSVPLVDNANALPNPTASQMDNLQRRYSGRQARDSPSSMSTTHRRSGSGNSVVPPSPPRAAKGAVGPVSSSSNMPLSPTRSLSRSNSRSSNQSFSMSTPNLQRPNYSRLDTIQSIASGHEVPQRSRSRSQDMSGRASRVGRPETGLSMRDDRAFLTPSPNSSRNTPKRKTGEAPMRVDANGRRQDFGTVTTVSGGDDLNKKKGTKCIIM